ncbi:MAG: 16S rRNA (adenine(1518)-N(6)/adenine(1519)-N(6))-dimethyltransferase RsmA [Pseudomonadota bacterium]
MPIFAKKRFSQNFLKDQRVIENIIRLLQPRKDQHWVEIGPGLGALTTALLQKTGELDVIEIDRDLIAPLTAACELLGELHVHVYDALKFDFHSLVTQQEKLHVVGNLPYHISSPLIFYLLKFANDIQDMHFMLQKEVVDRIVAKPGSKTYGRLSVMVQYFCRAEKLLNIPPTAFYPVPKVHSAIVRLEPYKKKPVTCKDETVFTEVVKQAFSQRRKTISNALKKLVSAQTLAAVGIDPSLRAEMLPVEAFINVSNAL